ncbi:hypothetical protein BsWGS_25863 [Bradybaena similaris]
MAKIVLAGRSDCPYFARCELLGDRLARNLQKFKLHKIIVQPEKWENWLANTCSERGWNFKKSPIIWRELIDRGGKGVLIGDANDFQEYAKAYYDVMSVLTTEDMNIVSWENKVTKDLFDEEEKYYRSLSEPIIVCITNAASPTCYHLLNSLATGQVFGPGVEIFIRLLVSSPSDYEFVKGTAMEAEDLASGILRGVQVCTNPHDAFVDCRCIIVLDTVNKRKTESEKEWLERNEDFFSRYGQIINDKALKSCQVLLCGAGPLNFNATIMVENAPDLPHQNIVVVSSHIENRAKSVIGAKLNVNPAGVVDLVVWGNVNESYFLDVSNCQVHGHRGAVRGPDWYSVKAVDMIRDKKWIEKEFPKLVAARHKSAEAEANQMTGLSSATAISSTLQKWRRGSTQNEVSSLGVYSEGWYGVPIGMFFSFPVTMRLGGSWQVVEDIEMNKEITQAIEASVKEQGLQFMLCMADRRKPESLSQLDKVSLDKVSLDSGKLSFWSLLSLSRPHGADLHTQMPYIEITSTAGSFHETTSEPEKHSQEAEKHSQEAEKHSLEVKVNLRNDKSLVVVHEGSTVTLADVTLGADDGNLTQDEHLPLSDATLAEDNLSQPDVQPLLNDEDNTSQEIVTIEDVSASLDGTNKPGPIS